MALLTNIKRWSYAFKKHLTDHVVTSLADLNDFIEKADEGLMTQASGPSLTKSCPFNIFQKRLQIPSKYSILAKFTYVFRPCQQNVKFPNV